MWEPVLGELGTLGPLPKPDQRMGEGSIGLRPLHPEAPHCPKMFPPPGSGESNAPGGRSVPTPRGRCRLALTVGDRRPPLPPLSRTAPHYAGLGRKGVRPGPRHPGAAQLKRRAQQPVGDHSSAGRRGSPVSRSEMGRGRGGARAPGVGRCEEAGPCGSGGGVLGGGDWGWPGDLASWGWGASFCNG